MEFKFIVSLRANQIGLFSLTVLVLFLLLRFFFVLAFIFSEGELVLKSRHQLWRGISLKSCNWKIICYIYLHYEIVLLMNWVQYGSLNIRSSSHRISGKDFWHLELARKSCILSPFDNRTFNIHCYFVKGIYLQNSFSFYNKHSLE